jgi:CNT family concentrative nucleoside transporter
VQQLISLVGIVTIVGLAVALSTERKAIRWRTVAVGLGFQFLLAVFILKTEQGKQLFRTLGHGVTSLLEFSKQGAGFLFGPLAGSEQFPFVFAFQVLPTIIFMASIISVLYYMGVIQKIVQGLAWFMSKTMGTSGAESLSSAACVFVGQVEGPLMVRPYIPEMTKSELMALMTGGMATIAGGVMAAYIGMLGADWAPHLLAASLMGAPAGLVMAKLIVPETEESKTLGGVSLHVEKTESSVIEAAAKGASDGMHLGFAVAAMLIAFISLVAMVNAGLGLANAGVMKAITFGMVSQPLSLELVLGTLFAPLAFLMGVPWAESMQVGNYIGQKLSLNEFVAYSNLKASIGAGTISERAAMIATFALCGFANFSSIAQNVGGIGQMAPSRRGDLARLGLRAMLAGALASCMSAAIAGLLVG